MTNNIQHLAAEAQDSARSAAWQELNRRCDSAMQDGDSEAAEESLAEMADIFEGGLARWFGLMEGTLEEAVREAVNAAVNEGADVIA